MAFGELLKIIGVGLVTLIAYIIVKPIKPDMAVFISIAGSCVILLFCINSISSVFNAINNLVQKTGINSSLVSLILKIIGIGYLIEFASGLCVESGVPSIADKISLAGKICILVLSLPIITSLLNIIVEILP